MYRVDGLSKSFGGQRLFEDLSWTLNERERVGLVGPNGAGKTTLLRILAGEEVADGGGFSAPRSAGVGYLPQEIVRATDLCALDYAIRACPEPLAIKERLSHIEAEFSEVDAPDTDTTPDTTPQPAVSAAHASALAAEHADLLQRYQMLGGPTLEARAQEILQGLGFTSEKMRQPMATLSGGWGMRAHLAGLLLAQPALLLLDEPTNHLDLQSLAWLETFLATYGGAWIVVSHDRYFLNRTTQSIAELRPSGLRVFAGNYDAYQRAREELDAQEQKAAQQHEQRARALSSFVDRFRYQATKAKQAQSRLKMLERLERDRPAADVPSTPSKNRRMRLQLPEAPRSGARVLRLENACKHFGSLVVYDSVNLDVCRGEKIALVGNNGAGKSTLLKMLAGVLPLTDGRREEGHQVSTYYYAQHQLDVLNPDSTVLHELWQLMPDESESRVRGILGAFLFGADDMDKPVRVLSGGEKSRLVLTKMLAKPANVLLLDEPTNHLDLNSRAVLEEAISQFSGAIVFISHDRYFINRAATHVVEVQRGGSLRTFPGDYDYYLWKSAQASDTSAGGEDENPTTAHAATASNESLRSDASDRSPPSAAAQARLDRKAEARERNRRAKEAAQLEESITRMEDRVAAIDAALCQSEVYADAEQCQRLSEERATLLAELDAQMQRWTEVSE